jgi:hypothetical protein
MSRGGFGRRDREDCGFEGIGKSKGTVGEGKGTVGRDK